MSITIKQAFQKLAMVTGAAVKNPWFIGRNLSQAFADIADNVVDASGDKVIVNQTITEGTEIGSIKVNNNTTKLYAPSSGIEYSTTERKIGKWVDGSDLYQRTWNNLTVSLTANSWVSTGISATDIDTIVDGMMQDDTKQKIGGTIGFISSGAYIGVYPILGERDLTTLTVLYTKISN